MTSLPEIGLIVQTSLVTWIFWETVRDRATRWIKPDYHFIPVTIIAATVYVLAPLTPQAHNVVTAVALVALLHYLLSKAEKRR